MSKVAANMVGRSLAADLRGRGVVVVCIHPGAVQTDLYDSYHSSVQSSGGGAAGRPPPLSPEESVNGMLAVLERCGLEESGSFLSVDGSVLPW